MDRHLKTLELDKILAMLANEATIKDVKEEALNISPSNALFEVNELLKQTNDAHMLIGRFGAPSFSGISNNVNALRRAQAGGCLNQYELLQIASSLRVFRKIKEWRQKSASIETSIDGYFFNLYTNKTLEEKITDCIISEDELSDNASPALYDIRRKIRIANSKAREVLDKIIRSSTYQKYLQDNIITQRDGRFVVPVKAECRNSVAGLVHDTSSSGATVFIEPMGVVNANNDIRILQGKEEAEIERILFELSSFAGGCADEITQSYRDVCDLDLVFAKAHLAYKMKASLPKVNDKGYIGLRQARHPLISKDTVVPTDISLGKTYDTLVITGPNTGGKTVSLKTIGLSCLMACCGLLIPANDNSEISIFRKFLVDIGDEQSIEQSLSTFSSHMTNIVNIIKEADRFSLVLIDELGAGTDPVEGAALAVSILEKLRSKGAKIAATTHYAELKEFALQTPGVENGCCEFDVSTLKPTYRLLIGVPGKSNAFAISSRLGIDDSIIERAKELVTTENRQFEDVVEKLEKRRQALDDEIRKAEELSAEAEKEKQKAKDELEKARLKAKKEIDDAKKEAQTLTSRTRSQAYALIDELNKAKKEKNLSPELKSKLKKDITKLEDEADPVISSRPSDYVLPRELKTGDNVLLFDMNLKAEVLEPPKDGKVLVSAGLLKTRTKLDNVMLLENSNKDNQKKRERSIIKNVTKRATTEIDLRGQTAMEAIIAVDQAIDNCILMNTHQLTIIHGKGTGVLRSEIHKHLKHQKNVKSFRLGTFGEGETGVTIVELK